jgi:predicted nucleic acid-binding protein
VGLTHLDAGVLIAFLDRDDVHHDMARGTLADARTRRDHLGIAASAVAECLVGPARRGDAAVAVVRDLLARLPIDVVALDEDVAVAAAMLRARHRALKLPDALVIATADAHGADRLITADQGWPSARSLRTRTIIEVLRPGARQK